MDVSAQIKCKQKMVSRFYFYLEHGPTYPWCITLHHFQHFNHLRFDWKVMKFILTVLSSEQRVTKLHCLKIDTHLTFQTTLTHPHHNFPGLQFIIGWWIGYLFYVIWYLHDTLGMKNWKILANLETWNKCKRSIHLYFVLYSEFWLYWEE